MNRKLVIVFGLLAMAGFSSAANAQVTNVSGKQYREFAANVKVSNGETKTALLQVNTGLRVDVFGEPEIPAHGFYNYMVTGSVLEGDQTCDFEILLTQTDLLRASTDETLKSRRDRSGVVRLCSGLSLDIASVRTLLLDASMTVSMRAPGLTQAIGSGSLVSNGLKTVPEDSIED